MLCMLTDFVQCDSVREINWDYVGDSVPAFLTLIIIPLTYKYVLISNNLYLSTLNADRNCSIAYGVIAGIISYVLLNGVAWALRKISGDRIAPPALDASEPWVIPPGGIVPTWM